MKAIVLIGVIALVACGIFVALSNMQHGSMDKLLQEGNGSIHEKKRETATLNAKLGEALDQPNPLDLRAHDETTAVSGPSWSDQLGKVIDGSASTIKNLTTSIGHRSPGPRLAPPGVYFTLVPLSVHIPSGITGLSAGTRLVCLKDEGAVLLVKTGNLRFEVKRSFLTKNLDLADRASSNDAEAQQAVAQAIAEQEAADQANRQEKNAAFSQERKAVEARRAAEAEASRYDNPLQHRPYDPR